jgi:hypothetical protein
MKTQNAIKKLAKAGYEAKHIRGEKNKTFQVVTDKQVLEFSSSEWSGVEEIGSIGIRPINQHSDPMTDYCAFTFYSNISRAIDSLNNY